MVDIILILPWVQFWDRVLPKHRFIAWVSCVCKACVAHVCVTLGLLFCHKVPPLLTGYIIKDTSWLSYPDWICTVPNLTSTSTFCRKGAVLYYGAWVILVTIFLRRRRLSTLSQEKKRITHYTNSLVNSTFGSGNKLCEPKIVLTKLKLTWTYIFTLREFHIMWKVSMYVI